MRIRAGRAEPAPVRTPIGVAIRRLEALAEDGHPSDFAGARSRIGRHLKSPANSQLPLLFVDVDGVISLFGFHVDKRPAGAFLTVDGIPHYLSSAAGEHLRALSEQFELVWCTGWEEKANDYLPSALELAGPLPYLRFSDSPGAGARHWKLDAIEAHAGPDRPLAWIDDDHAGCEEWAAARPGPTLLVTSPPHEGITAAHVELLLTWAAELKP